MSVQGEGAFSLEEIQARMNELADENARLRQATHNLQGRLEEARTTHRPADAAKGEVERLSRLVSKFDGDAQKYEAFRTEVIYFLEKHKNAFAKDEDRVEFIISRLEGAGKQWVLPYLSDNSACLRDQDRFIEVMDGTFRNAVDRQMKEQRLLALRQGGRTVREYWSEFSFLACQLDWDTGAGFMMSHFRRGLAPEVKDELARLGTPPEGMAELVRAALAIGLRQEERASEKGVEFKSRWEKARSPGWKEEALSKGAQGRDLEEPMELGHARDLPRATARPKEKGEERKESRKCFFCRQMGHIVRDCPRKKQWQASAGEAETPAPRQVEEPAGNERA